ncbi:MAG: HD domain-containing protein [Elusimicrobia bacterium]|nr:HD domain-containing protein [Elusimicrobiota bacterium]
MPLIEALTLAACPLAVAALLALFGHDAGAAFAAAGLTLAGLLAGSLARRRGETSAEPSVPVVAAVPVPAPAPVTPPPADATASLIERARALESEKQRIEAVLHTSMDPFVAKLIIDGKINNEKRKATVLFADLVAYTTASESRPPEAVIEEVDILFSAMEPVLKRFRGHLDKYMGDALMAEFGAPFPCRSHALMAALAALRMQERMASWEFPWKMRIGITSGTLLVGLIGSGTRKNYTAIGDKVNLASRLQQLCPPGGIWIDDEVYKAVHRWFLTRRVRSGLTPEETRDIEAKLAFLKEALAQAPTGKMCSEAANLCSELGDMDQALTFHKQALDLDKDSGPAQHALAATIMTGEERAFLTIKGKKQRVEVHELLGLKETICYGRRLPKRVVDVFQRLSKEVTVPEEWVLCIEAAEGSLGHAKSTAALSAALAEYVGLDEAVVRQAFLAGYLHDVGKRSVPEHLLTYDGLLSDLPASDRLLVLDHVTAAEAVLKDIKVPVSAEVLAGINQHHESFDGSGYPKKLKGKEISVLARIIKIAETYDTLTSWHPYQEAWTPEAALAEVGRDINRRRADPELGEAFLRMMGVNETESATLLPPVT